MTDMVRTRFAPSPTGYMHIGNLRTALYGYLFAKKYNGKFVLRIEDTDQERFVEGSIDVIYKTLALAGLSHDEGPDIGGDYGPYVQSERKVLYMEYAKKLVLQGSAYYCFCDKERLDSLKVSFEGSQTIHKYDRHCLSLSKEDIEKNLRDGIPFVIRQKMPTVGTTSFDDVVYGTISVDNSELDDQILIKSDGMPTYNFANVVDDHLMNITHIVRGNEYLSSTPKYNLLYQAFGWTIPTYVHLPLILRTTGQKLSKRAGDPSFEDLISMGYLPQAIINYVALLGWSPGTTQEIFDLQGLIQAFSIDGVNKAPAVFDIVKLSWMNGEYIKALPIEKFHKLACNYYKDINLSKDIDLLKISELLQARTDVLSTIPENIDFLVELPDYDISIYTHKKMKTNPTNSLDNLKAVLPVLTQLDEWTNDSIFEALKNLSEQLNVKSGQILWPLRIAISGKAVTPGGATEIAVILGKDETLRRIQIGIGKL